MGRYISISNRICKNEICKKDFQCKKWEKKLYCCNSCVSKDPNRVNGMKGKNNFDIWVNKYGLEKALKIKESVSNKQSVIRSNYLSNLTEEERKIKCTAKNSTKGKKMIDMLTDKYGSELAVEKYQNRLDILSEKLSNTQRPLETIAKIRNAKIKRVEEKIKTGISPRYNPEACKIIENYGKENGYNFQHAENGGETFVKGVGCFLDGYDKDKNVVIEFYERFHYNINGELKSKDLRRENDIIKFLKCSFIRINAYDKNNLKIEIIQI